MSYKNELMDLVLLLRNGSLLRERVHEPDTVPWFDRCGRWAEIIEFAILHPDEFKANLDT